MNQSIQTNVSSARVDLIYNKFDCTVSMLCTIKYSQSRIAQHKICYSNNTKHALLTQDTVKLTIKCDFIQATDVEK